jgi:hypothetical protein
MFAKNLTTFAECYVYVGVNEFNIQKHILESLGL